jgi:hypothetical protein
VNGSFKRFFPRLTVPVHPRDTEYIREVMTVAIHLFNLRTRRVGYNQLRSTYMRHVDANYSAQMAMTTAEDYISAARAMAAPAWE